MAGPGAVTGVGRTDISGVDAATHAEQQLQRFVGLPHYTTRGPEIDALQRSLNYMGARLGLDAVYGPKTEAAVQEFLARDMPDLQHGAGMRGRFQDRKAVRRLQHALTVITGQHLEPDGRFGDKTRAALVAWQQSLGINNPSPEGVVNRGTWNALLAGMVDKWKTPPVPRPRPTVTTAPTATGTNGALRLPDANGVSTPSSSPSTVNNMVTTVSTRSRPSANWPPNLSRFSNHGVNTRLPQNDPNIHHYKPLAYGTPRTIAMLEAVAAEYNARTGYVLRVGDISQRGGGDVGGHSSHEEGRKIDLDLAFNDGRTTAEPNRESRNAKYTSPAYDRDATRTLIRLIKQCNPNAEILFNDDVLIEEGLVRPYSGHDNHMHVQRLY